MIYKICYRFANCHDNNLPSVKAFSVTLLERVVKIGNTRFPPFLSFIILLHKMNHNNCDYWGRFP